MRTENFGDDKDRVIIRSNGELAYFAADTAYYLDKRERGFDRCIIMLGADHHGYVGRMQAMCRLRRRRPGAEPRVLIGQMVNLLRDGEPLRMSKRAGDHRHPRRPGGRDRRRRAAATRWPATPPTAR